MWCESKGSLLDWLSCGVLVVLALATVGGIVGYVVIA